LIALPPPSAPLFIGSTLCEPVSRDLYVEEMQSGRWWKDRDVKSACTAASTIAAHDVGWQWPWFEGY